MTRAVPPNHNPQYGAEYVVPAAGKVTYVHVEAGRICGGGAGGSPGHPGTVVISIVDTNGARSQIVVRAAHLSTARPGAVGADTAAAGSEASPPSHIGPITPGVRYVWPVGGAPRVGGGGHSSCALWRIVQDWARQARSKFRRVAVGHEKADPAQDGVAPGDRPGAVGTDAGRRPGVAVDVADLDAVGGGGVGRDHPGASALEREKHRVEFLGGQSQVGGTTASQVRDELHAPLVGGHRNSDLALTAHDLGSIGSVRTSDVARAAVQAPRDGLRVAIPLGGRP